MPNDPERPIERLLRDYAEKRRREARGAFDLHPVNRRLLQEEASRVSRAAQPERGWRAIFATRAWPRWSYGFAIVGGLVLVAKLMLPGITPTSPVGSLAKNEKIAPPALTQESQVLPTPPANSPGLATVQPPTQAEPFALALADKSIAKPSDLLARSDLKESQKDENVVAASRALGRNESPPAAPALQQPSTVFLSQDAGAVAQQLKQFEAPAQLVRASAKEDSTNSRWSNTVPATLILASFRVELNGQEIRFIDKDGSIYDGSITQPQALTAVEAQFAKGGAPNTLRGSERRRLSSPTTVSKAQPQGQVNYSFRVVGTNITLKEKVVFSGQLVPLNQAFGSIGITNATASSLGGAATAPPRMVLQTTPECRVLGKAVIEGGSEIQINALPTK